VPYDRPHITVAAVIEREGRFLMVEESPEGSAVYNQPAGHLEPGETLVEAVVREVREETAWCFHPEQIVAIYSWTRPEDQRTYLRVCFSGHCSNHQSEQPLDEGIIQALWISRDELTQGKERLRSPMVMRCIDDYIAGQHYPLDLITEL